MIVISVIEAKDIIPVIKETLNLVDSRLIEHGARVAYILEKMLLTLKGGVYDRSLYDICMLGFLHDIGAYKTEEIDDMLMFDAASVWEHSIYGYLFIKYMSPLSSIADAVKYHHLNYEKYILDENGNLPFNYEIALLIKIADRIDMALLATQDKEVVENVLVSGIGIKFKPDHVKLFRNADDKYHLLDHLLNNSYTTDSALYLQDMPFSYKEIIGYLAMLALSIDFRSEQTVSHTIVTVLASAILASLLNIGRDTCVKIVISSYLHDIGKIGIPRCILEKPSSLTQEEMLIMKTHVTLTRDLLSPYIDKEICEIASRHHERLDGSGYPDCLKHSEMTLPQELVAVADVLSALIGRRSYKPPFSKEVIISELTTQKENGKLSPAVVDVCLANYDDIAADLKTIIADIERLYAGLQKEYGITLSNFENKDFFSDIEMNDIPKVGGNLKMHDRIKNIFIYR